MNRIFAIKGPAKKRECGLSLVELLIATLLGLIIIAALTQLFADVSRTNREMVKTNSQIENARFAMQFLRNDIVHAGFWSAWIPQFDDLMFQDVPLDVPAAADAGAPCRAYGDWNEAALPFLAPVPVKQRIRNYHIGIPVEAYAAVPAGCGMLADHVTGTDVLVVRHADTCIATAPGCNPVAGALYFQASFNGNDPSPYALDIYSSASMSLTDLEGNIAGQRRYIQNIYYIRSWANDPADGIPTLVRSEFGVEGGVPAQGSTANVNLIPLVQGIERFRVELALDEQNNLGNPVTAATAGPAPNFPATPDALAAYANPVDWLDPDDRRAPQNRGDGVPERFVSCPAAGCPTNQLINVTAVRLHLLARASESSPGYVDNKSYILGGTTVGPFGDDFKRHVFSTTIRVNNVASRRETP